MKKSYLAVAIGAIGAMGAISPAQAIDKTRTLAAIGAGRVAYISGATAPTKAIYSSLRSLCENTVADPIDTWKSGTVTAPFFDPGDTGYGNFFSYSCKLKAGLVDPDGVAIAWSGQDVMINFGVTDGSFSSVRGMTTATTGANIQNGFVKADLLTCVTNANITSFGDKINTACTTEFKRSMGGFSDVEWPLFQDIFVGIPGVARADIETTAVNLGQVFGVAVSQPLYKALQVAQGITTPGCIDDVTFGVPVGVDDRSPACQPSITSMQYRSIANADSFGAARGGWGFMGVAGNPKLNLARRVAVSGTQASSNAFFLSNPCAGGGLTGGKLAPAGTTSTTTYRVTLNSGTSNVRTQLNNATAPDNFTIGVMSLENVPEGTDTWAFIKLDGVSPNEDSKARASAIDGRYPFVMELALHTNVNAAVTPLEPKQILKLVALDLGNPTLPASDLTGAFQTPSAAFSNSAFPTRVSKASKFNNNCQPLAQ
jgi:hypothetical protein